MARVLDIIIPATIPKHRKHMGDEHGWLDVGQGLRVKGLRRMRRLRRLGAREPGSVVAASQGKVLWGA